MKKISSVITIAKRFSSSSIPRKPIVVFDGVCNFCNSSINFVIDRDSKKHFLFSQMQSPYGKKLIQQHNLQQSLEKDPTIVLFEPAEEPNKYNYYIKSTAALRIGDQIDGLHWRLASKVFMWVPTFFRDWVYEIIAMNRYRIFGKSDTCRVPTADLKSRFLDWDEPNKNK